MYDHCAQLEIFYRNILVWDYGTPRIKISAVVHLGIPVNMIRSNNVQPHILICKLNLNVLTFSLNNFKWIVKKKVYTKVFTHPHGISNDNSCYFLPVIFSNLWKRINIKNIYIYIYIKNLNNNCDSQFWEKSLNCKIKSHNYLLCFITWQKQAFFLRLLF